jgi:hypothetical protein
MAIGRFSRPHPLNEEPWQLDDGHSQPLALLRVRTTALACQPEPPALVLNEASCYHFRVLDPRGFATLSATMNVATIGHRYHI